MKKLNLGCGKDIREGYVNLDKFPLEGVDVVHDIEKVPLPFADEEFDEILCDSILEHVNYVPLMKELHRILKKDGILKITVPHFTSANNFIDPTHKHMFSIQTFKFFVLGATERDYYFDFHFSDIVYRRITFPKGKQIHNYLIEWLINLNNSLRHVYELSFLRIFPAENIIIWLKK